jgi:HemK-related putative methylase
MPSIYEPAEDSFLISESVRNYLEDIPEEEKKKILVLDMGTGSGIQAESCVSEGIKKQNILCADINPEAVEYISSLGFNSVKSDLFSSKQIQGMKFDLIIFNPPYLPAHRYDSQSDTTGGEKGDEVISAFILASKNYLTENGKIILLISSLTPGKKIEREMKKNNFKKKVVNKKKLFFETLEVWLINQGR